MSGDNQLEASLPTTPVSLSSDWPSRGRRRQLWQHFRHIKLVQQESARFLGIKLGQWALFTVIVALLPIVLDTLSEISKPEGLDRSTFYTLISHGELALICAAITAEAMGAIFVSGRRGCRTLLAFGMCCTIFFLSAGIYVLAKITISPNQALANMSIVMFFGTLFAGGSCKLLAEKENESLREQRRGTKK